MDIGLANKGSNRNILLKGIVLFWAGIFALFVAVLIQYEGQVYVYVLFSLVSNCLLYFGFRKKAIFFDTFIGLLFWLGFWLKLSVRVVFMDGNFYESVGNFDGSGAAFDQALLVSSCGLFGLVTASYIREKFLFTYPEQLNEIDESGLFRFYRNNRKFILSLFVILFAFIAVTNIYFGIYQRGAIPRTILPYGLSGVYKWLLLFGLASISALILKYEITINRKTSYLVVILGLMETFFSNVSLLSRGMIINAGALGYGVFKGLKLYNLKSNYKFFGISLLILLVLFISSIYTVNYLRSPEFNQLLNKPGADISAGFQNYLGTNTNIVLQLLIDRWVGMEGILAVTSYPDKGWDLWHEAWKEQFRYNKLTFYDENLITSQYRNTDLTKHHHISLPGIIAFWFYPGSYLFLFVSMIALGLFAGLIEMAVFKFGGKNVILCSLLAMVVAFRYAHFGYVPRQSYLLFGSLFLNLFIIFLADKLLSYWYNRKGREVSSLKSG